MSLIIKKLVFPVLVLTLTLVMTLYFICNYHSANQSINYTLKSYKNSVALFENEKLIKIYDEIVLNTLPEKDIQSFNSGISVASQAQAELILENFDG